MVMVVDDEQILRQIAREILEEIGFNVILAEDGEEAVSIYRKEYERIRVVLLDMLMPKLSGNEVYSKMKKINPDVKVILTSGFRKDKRVEQALNAGADGFIKKPYNFKRLSEMIFQVLKGKSKSPIN
jgi:DNA-binding NtrC family response regulator